MKKIILLIIVLILATSCTTEKKYAPFSSDTSTIQEESASEISSDPRDPVHIYEVEKNIKEVSQEEKHIISSLNNDEKEDPEYFHYQLQDTNLEKLKDLDVDYIIIDVDDSEFTQSEVQSLKDSGKIVLSYLSIGEAEDYRSYWQDEWEEGSPNFLMEENPEWEGNYKVAYWIPEWQDIMISQLNNIMSLGYDGVYIDRVDAYQDFLHFSSVQSREAMLSFILKLSKHAKTNKEDFLVFGQNAVELCEDERYKNSVDGIAREDLWYDDDEKQDSEDTEYALDFLEDAKKDGKTILVIDYPTKDSNICNFYEKCIKEDFICTVSDRDLDEDKPVTCKE